MKQLISCVTCLNLRFEPVTVELLERSQRFPRLATEALKTGVVPQSGLEEP
jgi:hypothetical protein